MTKQEIHRDILEQLFKLKHTTFSGDSHPILYIDQGSFNEYTRGITMIDDRDTAKCAMMGLEYFIVDSFDTHINVSYRN